MKTFFLTLFLSTFAMAGTLSGSVTLVLTEQTCFTEAESDKALAGLRQVVSEVSDFFPSCKALQSIPSYKEAFSKDYELDLYFFEDAANFNIVSRNSSLCALFVPPNKIIFSPIAWKDLLYINNCSNLEETLMHELIHAVTKEGHVKGATPTNPDRIYLTAIVCFAEYVLQRRNN